MKILVTGAAGYIGSVLCGYLLDAGHEVTALDSFMYGQTSLAQYCAHPKFQIMCGNVRDEHAWIAAMKGKDAIIPLAAIVGAAACKLNETAAVSTNHIAIRRLCEFADPTQIILYPNTNSGYGIGKEDVCTEESELKPLSLYGITKVDAEKCVMERNNSVSFRLATVFGASPRMRTDLMVNEFVYRAVRDKSLVLFEPKFRRNFVHVRDVATVFVYALQRFEVMRGKVFNVGDSRANMTKEQLCAKIAEHIDFTWIVAEFGSDPDKRDYLVENKRIENTGWMPSRSLDDGIKELIKLYAMLNDRKYGNA